VVETKGEKYRLFASPRDILGITLRLIEEQLHSEEAPKVIKAIGREAGATPITYFNCRGSGPIARRSGICPAQSQGDIIAARSGPSFSSLFLLARVLRHQFSLDPWHSEDA
jgi:hypothetical protein